MTNGNPILDGVYHAKRVGMSDAYILKLLQHNPRFFDQSPDAYMIDQIEAFAQEARVWLLNGKTEHEPSVNPFISNIKFERLIAEGGGIHAMIEEGLLSENAEVETEEDDYDPVKIPSHYTSGKIEVANFIADQGLDWATGNAVKYIVRAGKKDPDKELQDIEKGAALLQMKYNLAQGLPAVVRDPDTNEVVWSLFKN